jgi:site-specific DNA recombinase
MENQAEPKGSFEENLEPALQFLASPSKLWQTGNIILRRLVLKLAFTGPIKYCRNEGAKTTENAFPLTGLSTSAGLHLINGARGRNRTTDTRIFSPLLYP